METGSINTTGPSGPHEPVQPSVHEVVCLAKPLRQREFARQPEWQSDARYVESHWRAPAIEAEDAIQTV